LSSYLIIFIFVGLVLAYLGVPNGGVFRMGGCSEWGCTDLRY
jgi:hypothetical protein